MSLVPRPFPEPRSRRRTATVLAFALASLLLLGPVRASDAAASVGRLEHKLLRIVNETRDRHDLRALKFVRSLSVDGERHTRKMIRRNRIYDPPNLNDILARYRWDDLGADVVGCGNTLRELHRILMTENFHREILLHQKLRRAGIGVVRADERNRCGRGSFWATEIFYG